MLANMRLSALFCSSLVLATGFAARAAAADYSLRSSPAQGETSQVEVLLEVGGDLSLQDEKEKRLQTLKMSVVGTMVYNEKLLTPPAASDTRSVRQYRRGEAVIKIDQGMTKPRLRDERRLVGVACGETAPVLYSVGGALSRDELDLIEVPACSLLVDRLLPARQVAPGDEWQHADNLIGQLLNLDAVSETKVVSKFKEVSATAAQLEIAGTVRGANGGVTTEIELKGRYKFDLEKQRITWLALLVKEKRGIGSVAPGVDVTARLQMKVTPNSGCPELTDDALAGIPLDQEKQMTLLECESAEGKYRLTHERDWHLVSETPKTVVLRLVDRGELLAQCNASALAPTPAGKRLTLEKFQEDVQKSLDKHFEQFVSSGESTNSAGHHVCKVVAVGKVEELPIQWNYYLVSDTHGNQVVLSFTLERELVDRFAQQDESLVATLEFLNRPTDTAAQPTLAPARK